MVAGGMIDLMPTQPAPSPCRVCVVYVWWKVGSRCSRGWRLHHTLDGHLCLCSCLLDFKCIASLAWDWTFPHLCTFIWLNPIHPLSKASSFRTDFLTSRFHVTLLAIHSQISNSGVCWVSYRLSCHSVLPALQSRTHYLWKVHLYSSQETFTPGTTQHCHVLLGPNLDQQPSFC